MNNIDLSKVLVFDIETDSLTPTKVWCCVVKELGSGQVWEFTPDTICTFADFVRSRGPEVKWIGHNIVSFDAVWCNRILGTNFRVDQLIDSLILGYLYWPKIPEGHSLEAWGVRFGFPKGDHSDWTQFSPEMLSYCRRDVELTAKLYLSLVGKMLKRGFSERSCELEHRIRFVVNKQQSNGFYFDIPRAEQLLEQLRQRQADLAEPIQQLFPPALVQTSTLKYRIRKDGLPHSSVSKAFESYDHVRREGDSLLCFDYRPFNIGSPPQRVDRLLSLGWEPSKFTDGGAPQADEEAVLGFLEKATENKKELQAIADWLVANGRGNMVQTWLDNVNYADSCIHGRVNTCGAATRRMTHSAPNTANIPKAKAKVQFGRECRSLWRARPGRVLVGYDAKGLEMRMFVHYLGAPPEVVKLYVEGDPHGRNAEIWSNNPWGYVVDRDGPPGAKTGFYAGLYGAYDPKLGDSIVPGGGERFGKWARQELYRSTPGLQRLVDEITSEFNGNDGWLKTIDGGYVRCTKLSAALNYKCQSAGGIVMKQAAIILDRACRRKGLDALLVGSIHDEGQLDCKVEDAEEVGRTAVQSIRDAGQELGFLLDLDGDFKVAEDWSRTH